MVQKHWFLGLGLSMSFALACGNDTRPLSQIEEPDDIECIDEEIATSLPVDDDDVLGDEVLPDPGLEDGTVVDPTLDEEPEVDPEEDTLEEPTSEVDVEDEPEDLSDTPEDDAIDTLPTFHEFTVDGEYRLPLPPEVSRIAIQLWGAGGAGGSQAGATGGGGAYVSAELSVIGGEILTIYVGQGGIQAGQGGGASYVLMGEDIVAVAGAGGGGASDGNSGNSWAGGAGGAGGRIGQNGGDLGSGPAYSYCRGATGGKGATQNAGGEGGGAPVGTAENLCNGEDGTSNQGGGQSTLSGSGHCSSVGATFWNAGNPGGSNGHGGSGGGGYFGGGGGAAIWTYCGAGGGGGSSWVVGDALEAVYLDGGGQSEGNYNESNGVGRGGDRCQNIPGATCDRQGRNGYVSVSW